MKCSSECIPVPGRRDNLLAILELELVNCATTVYFLDEQDAAEIETQQKPPRRRGLGELRFLIYLYLELEALLRIKIENIMLKQSLVRIHVYIFSLSSSHSLHLSTVNNTQLSSPY